MQPDTINLISAIIGFILGLGVVRKYYAKFKETLMRGIDVIQEVSELLEDIEKAIEDDTVTKDELKKVINDWKDVIESFKEFVDTATSKKS